MKQFTYAMSIVFICIIFICVKSNAQLSFAKNQFDSTLLKSKSSHQILTDEEANAIINERKGSVRYVDFHIHTTFKNYYNHIKSPTWLDQNLPFNPELTKLNWNGSKRKPNNKFNHFKSFRQADFGILENSQASMLASSISPIEKRMVAKEKVILGLSLRFINKVMVTHLPFRRLKKLYEKENSSFDEFNSELKFLTSQQNESPTLSGYQIGATKTKEELIDNFRRGKTSLVISLEGAHNLHGDSISMNETLTQKPLRREFSQGEIDEYLNNVDSIKNLQFRVLFMTLGHFAWNGVVGSAKTLDMEKVRWLLLNKSRFEKFRKKLFYKPGDGIIGDVYDTPLKKNSKSLSKAEKSDLREEIRQEKGMKKSKICDCVREPVTTANLGWQVIEKLLDTSGGKAPIYIDVKHMDIKARYQYYSFLDTTTRYRNIPIIASHVGASGEDSILANYTGLCPVYDVYQEVSNTKKFYQYQSAKPYECILITESRKDTVDWFYPWSINLSDEEISRIYKSDGIIGIALEERVIGSGRPNYKKYKASLIQFMESKGEHDKDKIELFDKMQPLFRNIFYFVEKSGREDVSAWNHLSLGSDFDGIARPLSFCRTAGEIPKLHSLLVEYLPYFIEYANMAKFTYNLTSKEMADKLVFENGERFILKYF